MSYINCPFDRDLELASVAGLSFLSFYSHTFLSSLKKIHSWKKKCVCFRQHVTWSYHYRTFLAKFFHSKKSSYRPGILNLQQFNWNFSHLKIENYFHRDCSQQFYTMNVIHPFPATINSLTFWSIKWESSPASFFIFSHRGNLSFPIKFLDFLPRKRTDLLRMLSYVWVRLRERTWILFDIFWMSSVEE